MVTLVKEAAKNAELGQEGAFRCVVLLACLNDGQHSCTHVWLAQYLSALRANTIVERLSRLVQGKFDTYYLFLLFLLLSE